jgi:ferredoxin
MGTVRGDLHDIGKNLVCMMAEGAGFQVHDIGVDQSIEKFLAAAELQAGHHRHERAADHHHDLHESGRLTASRKRAWATSKWPSAARPSARCTPTKSAPTATARTPPARWICSWRRAGSTTPTNGRYAHHQRAIDPGQAGLSLFDQAEALAIDVPTSCRKQGKCKECMVEVVEGMDALSPMTEPERHLKGNFRLSCQTFVTGCGNRPRPLPHHAPRPHAHRAPGHRMLPGSGQR